MDCGPTRNTIEGSIRMETRNLKALCDLFLVGLPARLFADIYNSNIYNVFTTYEYSEAVITFMWVELFVITDYLIS